MEANSTPTIGLCCVLRVSSMMLPTAHAPTYLPLEVPNPQARSDDLSNEGAGEAFWLGIVALFAGIAAIVALAILGSRDR